MSLHSGGICLMLIGVIICVGHCSGKRVVIIPLPFTSHSNYHTKVARALVEKGHETWLMIAQKVLDKKVLDVSGSHVIPYGQDYVNYEELTMTKMRDSYWKNEEQDIMFLAEKLLEYTDTVLRDNYILDQIQSLKPDLIVIDNLPYAKCLCILAYKLGVPFAYVGSTYDAVSHRIPIYPSVYPFPMSETSDHMEFKDRLKSFVLVMLSQIFNPFTYSDAVARYAPEKEYLPILKLVSRAEITLVEWEHILDYPQPTLPNVRCIGGTAASPPKPLKEPFQSFIDKSKGIILVTFGSYVLNVPEEFALKMERAFMNLDVNIIWRINRTSPDKEKILTSTWVPQNDILGSGKVLVFVSHCGKNGQYEALYHGVVTLCMPLFAEQLYNAHRAKVKGYGLTLDLRSTTEKELLSTIKELYTNKTYQEIISKASEIFREVHGVPMKTAAFWLDHVMKYGGSYMRYAGQELPLYQFFSLDVIAFLGGIILFLFHTLIFCLAKCCKCLSARTGRKSMKVE